MVAGDPLESGSKAEDIVKNIRKRKGLKEGIPSLGDYLDKLWEITLKTERELIFFYLIFFLSTTIFYKMY